MNVSRDVCFLSAEHDYRVFGNIRRTQGLDGPPRALGERCKGHSQESHDNKWEYFFHHIFLLLVNDMGSPFRDLSTGSLQTPCFPFLYSAICHSPYVPHRNAPANRHGKKNGYKVCCKIVRPQWLSVSQPNLEQSLFPGRNEEPHAQILV